jgi:CO/xanthine dehydrogenase FAD-binding subunit
MLFKEYHKPATIEEAMSLIRRKSPHTIALSGGSWLHGDSPRDIEAVVDISLLGLNMIEKQASPPLMRIGAGTTLQQLVEAFEPEQPAANGFPSFGVLSVTAQAMAGLSIRNSATIGDAIVTADSASPLVTALLAFDADLIVQANEERTLSLSAFLSYHERIIADGILVTQIVMPIPSADTLAAYERVVNASKDYPVVCAVARCAMKDGIAGNMRVAVGGVAPTPIRLSKLEFALEKKRIRDYLESTLQEAVQTLAPQSDWLGSAEYRAETAHVLARRAILTVEQRD